MTSWVESLTQGAAWLGAGVLLLAALVLGYQAGQWTATESPPEARIDTVEVGRTITRQDTLTETVPRTVVRYDTVRKVDTVRLAVPTSIDIKGVLPPLPIDIGDEVTLTYYDTQAQRWTQNRYDIPQDDWHFWPSVSAVTTPIGLQATAAVNLHWKKVTLSAGYMQAVDRRGLAVRIELRPFTLSW